MLALFSLSILSGIMDGEYGIVATSVTNVVAEDAVVVEVTDTDGFLDTGSVIVIGNEKISYTGITPTSFTGCIKGVEDTEAKAYPVGVTVYSEVLGLLNYALNVDVRSITAQGGDISALNMIKEFFVSTLPKMITWNYSFFTGELVLVRYALIVASIGFLVAFGLQLANILVQLLPW